jgi:ATP-binding cassette subfamily B protein
MSAAVEQRPAAATDEARGSDQKSKGEAALRRFHDEEDLERVYDLRMVLSLWPLLRPERRRVLGSIALLVSMSALGLSQPLIMKSALASFAEEGAAQLWRHGLLLAGLIVLEQLLAFPQLYWIQVAGARAMTALRSQIFTFLHSRSLAFFDRTPLGRLVTRVTNDVDAIGEMFSSGALNAIGDLIRLAAIVVILVTLDWRMSLFAFAVLPPVALMVNWARKRMRFAYRDVRAKTARMNAFLNEQVNGVGVVQAYARERQSEAAFDVINDSYREANTRAIVLDALLDASIEMVSSICIAAILWYAGVRTISPAIDFATLFAFVLYIDQFFTPIRNLSQRYTQIQSALAGAERVFELLASEDEDARLEQKSQAEHDDWPGDGHTAFALENVTFAYKAGHEVLSEVSLSARRGETIALVGPTGSGKSTIASLLLRLYEAQHGSVKVFDRDVRALDRSELRRQFAVVPQDVFLFPGSVANNVGASEATPDRERVLAVLEQIGARELFEAREGGIDAEVMERGSNFSAGERQLIAFARALYKNPPLLILDEPTASIDSDTETRLQRAMDAAMAGRTALVIAHRLSTIKNADRIVCLHQGRVIEQGSHDELIAHDGVYARLYRLQAARQAIADRVEQLAAS